MNRIRRDPLRVRGLSLIELMITIAIGSLLMAGLLSLYVRSARNESEANRAAEQFENGRYAIETLTGEFQLAGYLGPYQDSATPAALGDPCVTPAVADLSLAVQAYPAPSVSAAPTVPASCTALAGSVLQLGSDVVVVRRADSNALDWVAATPTVTNEVYLQANVSSAEVQVGAGAALTSSSNASGGSATLLKKDGSAAEIRKLHTRVYYVDRSGTVPTLRRLELGPGGMSSVAVAEGIERFAVEYGIDTSPTARDGVPDSYVRDPSLSQLADAVVVRLKVLARSTAISTGFTDAKSYDLGFSSAYVPNDQFKRHLFSTTVRLKNPAGKRE